MFYEISMSQNCYVCWRRWRQKHRHRISLCFDPIRFSFFLLPYLFLMQSTVMWFIIECKKSVRMCAKEKREESEIHSHLEQLCINPVDSRTNSQRHPFFKHFTVCASDWEKPKKIPFKKIDIVIAKKRAERNYPATEMHLINHIWHKNTTHTHYSWILRCDV